MQRLQDVTDTVEQITARLAIRLGVGHDVPRLCNDASLRLRAALDAIISGVEEDAFEVSKAEEAVGEAQELSGAFLRLAKKIVGSRVPEGTRTIST